MDDLELRPFRSGDEAAILDAFNLVFREVCGPSFVDRDLATWRWQFLDNPAGMRVHLAVAGDGTVAAQYAAVPVRARTPHGDTMLCQIVDSFVHPAYRQGLKRPGLFAITARAALEHWIDLGDGLFFGMPVENARKMSVRFLGYHTWRSVDYFCRDVGAGALRTSDEVSVARVDQPSPEVDRLAETVTRQKQLASVRDTAYLTWRYARCPSAPYELVEARRGGALTGVMVLRPGHELVAGACSIAELLVLEDDEVSLDALLAFADERARQHGRRRLMALFAPQAHEAGALHDRGFQTEPSAASFFRSIGCRPAQPGLRFTDVSTRWWYSLGDFDLV
ncbi:MAG: GNAT family N-acetyltransferase [Planctomycetota bacterium]